MGSVAKVVAAGTKPCLTGLLHASRFSVSSANSFPVNFLLGHFVHWLVCEAGWHSSYLAPPTSFSSTSSEYAVIAFRRFSPLGGTHPLSLECVVIPYLPNSLNNTQHSDLISASVVGCYSRSRFYPEPLLRPQICTKSHCKLVATLSET